MRKSKKTLLTSREVRLVAFAVQGLSSKEISESMSEFWHNASVSNIDNTYYNIYRKLGVSNRHALVKRALELGICHWDGKNLLVYFPEKV